MNVISYITPGRNGKNQTTYGIQYDNQAVNDRELIMRECTTKISKIFAYIRSFFGGNRVVIIKGKTYSADRTSIDNFEIDNRTDKVIKTIGRFCVRIGVVA